MEAVKVSEVRREVRNLKKTNGAGKERVVRVHISSLPAPS